MGLRSASRRVAEQGWLLGWLGLIVFGFATVLFPLRTDFLNRDSVELFVAPDAQVRLSTATLRESLGSLSARGRSIYAWSEVTLDGAFPVFYGLFLILGMQRLWPQPQRRAWGRLRTLSTLALPLVVVACDWLENAYFFRLARHPSWLGQGPPRPAEATTLAALEWWALHAHAAKFLALALCLVAVAAVLVKSGAAGRWLPYFWYGRVPATALAVLLGLSWYGGSGERSPTLPNMLLFDSALGLGLVVFLAAYLAALGGYQWVLIAELAPLRFGAVAAHLPDFAQRGAPGSVDRGLPFFVLALPLAARGASRSVLAGNLSVVAAFLAVVGGFAACWLVFRAVEKARGGAVKALAHALGLPARLRALERLGPGYWDAAREDLHPGHGLAVTAFFCGLAVYAVGYLSLSPASGSAFLRDLVPTLAYLVAMTSFLAAILAGVSFFADRWRIPLLSILVLWPIAWATLLPGDRGSHRFDGRWLGCKGAPERCLPEPGEALRARLRRERDRADIATIVTASGGGIQAAAWTAQVLTGLQRELGADFTRSIVLISSVSGGSVGSYFALEALDAEGRLPEQRLVPVLRAALTSSLEQTAWGLLYPDLLRGFFPLLSSRQDRAWAMERAWLTARQRAVGADATAGAWTTWVDGVRDGRLPAVLFNAVRVDDGGPFAISTVELASTRIKSFEHLPDEPGYLDLPRVTAARISATFPYVTPIAAPAAKDVRRWHLADGGYFDNHGVVGALAWTAAVRRAEGSPLAGIRTLLWLQIDGFAEELAAEPLSGPSWVLSSLGPLQATLKVRSNSQRVRRDEEIERLREAMSLVPGEHPELVVATVRPQSRGRTDPPLSWHLSDADSRRLCDDWRMTRFSEDMDIVRKVFGVDGDTTAKQTEDCPLPF